MIPEFNMSIELHFGSPNSVQGWCQTFQRSSFRIYTQAEAKAQQARDSAQRRIRRSFGNRYTEKDLGREDGANSPLDEWNYSLQNNRTIKCMNELDRASYSQFHRQAPASTTNRLPCCICNSTRRCNWKEPSNRQDSQCGRSQSLDMDTNSE